LKTKTHRGKKKGKSLSSLKKNRFPAQREGDKEKEKKKKQYNSFLLQAKEKNLPSRRKGNDKKEKKGSFLQAKPEREKGRGRGAILTTVGKREGKTAVASPKRKREKKKRVWVSRPEGTGKREEFFKIRKEKGEPPLEKRKSHDLLPKAKKKKAVFAQLSTKRGQKGRKGRPRETTRASNAPWPRQKGKKEK